MFFLKAVPNYKVFEVWFIYRRERAGFNSTTETSGKKEKNNTHGNCKGKMECHKIEQYQCYILKCQVSVFIIRD